MTQGAANGGPVPAFPVLTAVLAKYYPSEATGGVDKTPELIAAFRATGGTGLEFEGLVEEIKSAARQPEARAEAFEVAFGFVPDADTQHEALVELHDVLTETGRFSPDAIAKQAEEEVEARKAAKPTTDELLAAYAKPVVPLPGFLARFSAPLWVYFGASLAAMILAAVVLNFTPASWGVVGEVIRWPFMLIVVVSVIVAVASGVTMAGLRKDALRTDDTKPGRVSRLWKFR